MENKSPDRIPPKPGIAEAIHPEIGNGVSWETNPHHFLLRSPDPTKDVEHQLLGLDSIPVITTGSEKADAAILEHNEIPVEIASIEEPGPIDGEIASKSSDEISVQEESIIPSAPKKTKVKADRKKKSKTQDSDLPEEIESTIIGEPEDTQSKSPKAGKLVRKAAKSVRKQEEDRKKAIPHDLTLTDSSLSPYTQWLKGLRGSEYVHPYDDDFAFVQSTGPAKEGISETFAELLASQGYKEQAVEMYLKLMEKYPEKSGFFAAKIEALQ